MKPFYEFWIRVRRQDCSLDPVTGFFDQVFLFLRPQCTHGADRAHVLSNEDEYIAVEWTHCSSNPECHAIFARDNI